MTATRIPTAKDKQDFLQIVALGHAYRRNGRDWRMKHRWDATLGTGVAVRGPSKVQVSKNLIRELVEDGLIRLDTKDDWELTEMGQQHVNELAGTDV